MLNGKNLFIGALYHIDGKFSHLSKFNDIFQGEFEHLEYNVTDVHRKIEQIKGTFQAELEAKKIDNSNVLKLLALEELTKVSKVISDDKFKLAAKKFIEVQRCLFDTCQFGISILKEAGIAADVPKIFVVEDLPQPYNNAKFAALTIDEGDKAQFGIEPGIYFRKEKLQPFYSQTLVMHELIHTILGKKSPLLLARGLEEGFAELLGSIHLSIKYFGKELTKNIFVYNRLKFENNQFWELYLEYTRQATYLLNRFGLDGIREILDNGREKVKEVESFCLSGETSSLTLSAGNFDSDTIEVANYVSLLFGRNLVLSPLAFYLNRYVKAGMTSFEIIEAANVEKASGLDALKEISNRLYISHFRDDNAVCTFSDSSMLMNLIRYEIV